MLARFEGELRRHTFLTAVRHPGVTSAEPVTSNVIVIGGTTSALVLAEKDRRVIKKHLLNESRRIRHMKRFPITNSTTPTSPPLILGIMSLWNDGEYCSFVPKYTKLSQCAEKFLQRIFRRRIASSFANQDQD